MPITPTIDQETLFNAGIDIHEKKKMKDLFISNDYIIVPTLELEDVNELLLEFYKEKDIEIKLRLHSKNEYEFTGKIIKLFGKEESDKKSEAADKREEEEDKLIAEGKIEEPYYGMTHSHYERDYYWRGYYIILKDNKDNQIKLFLTDIDHRTIMPKDVEVIKPLLIFEREQIPPKLRFETLERFNHTCQYCGRKAPEVELEIDHIIPVSKGGLTQSDNLTVSCRDCNNGKSNKILDKIKRWFK